MPDPSASRDVAGLVRQWAEALREAGSEELDNYIGRVAAEIQAMLDEANGTAEEQFSELYRNAPAAMVLTSPEGHIAAANPAFLRLAGTAAESDVLGMQVSILGVSEQDRRRLRDAVAAEGTGEPRRLELRTGGSVRMTASAPPESGAGRVLMFEDLTARYTDGAGLGAELDELVASGAGQRMALLLVDLDGFAVIRDGLGFEGANEVLAGVSRTLREIFAGQRAHVTRLFGDMFAVALPGDHSAGAAGELAERIIGALAKPSYVDGLGIGVSASVGVALAGTVTGHTELVGSAQIALHRAKELGRTRWALFDPATGAGDRERYRLACGIAGALEAGELAVVYRPKAVLPDARLITTLNAGLRWRHPTLGELPPEQFYPLAEATGMTVLLGRYLLAEALRAAGDWRARFGDDAPRVCLNLPRRMAIDGDLVRVVETELTRNGLEHRHITLCTDGPSLVDERGDLLEALGELAAAGVSFVVDITGMAELELLPALKVPAMAVMLTGQVIDALEIDAPPSWAVRTIRQLVERAHEIGVQVGASGVICQEHADLLAEIGVVVGAGPYLPTHASAEEAEVWAGRVAPAE